MKYKQSLAEVCSEWTALIGGILLQRVCFPPASPAHGSTSTKHQHAWLPEDNWQVKCHFCSFPTQQLKGQRCCWIWLWQIHMGIHIQQYQPGKDCLKPTVSKPLCSPSTVALSQMPLQANRTIISITLLQNNRNGKDYVNSGEHVPTKGLDIRLFFKHHTGQNP